MPTLPEPMSRASKHSSLHMLKQYFFSGLEINYQDVRSAVKVVCRYIVQAQSSLMAEYRNSSTNEEK